jgi:hypothetical protein
LIDRLKNGDAEGVKQAMEKLRQQIEDLAKQPEGAARNDQLEKLAKELGQMANQLREQLGDEALNDSLARAAEQLAMSKREGLSKEALDAAVESLNLSKEEAQRLAEMFSDMENIEEALRNLAAAKQLNEQGRLDGREAQNAGAQSQQDYQKLYDELMRRMAESGEGRDQGGPETLGANAGVGTGGTGGTAGSTGEDDTTESEHKKQRATIQIGAGKVLMEWKDEGVGETGAKAGDYSDAIRAVKQGVAEAIRNERVPPGYHDAIQKYFDKLPEKRP